MTDRPRTRQRERSLFWPIVLIGAGVIWLLSNFNLIAPVNLGLLARLWPLFLIAAGLELLVGRGQALVSALMGLLTIGAVVGLMVYGPQLGLARGAELKTERFTEPLGEATAAGVTLDLSRYHAQVSALPDSANLIDAQVSFTGQIDFRASGSTQKTVSLAHNNSFSGPWDWFDSVEAATWTIGLSPRVPLDLKVNVGSGSANLDLAGLTLSGLSIDGGSGALDLNLPAGDGAEPYQAGLDGGSGRAVVNVPAEANGILEYEGGSGSLVLSVPPGAAVRVEVGDGGSGSVRVPGGWEQTRSGEGDAGTWQTAGFDTATRRFTLVVADLGSGSVSVK